MISTFCDVTFLNKYLHKRAEVQEHWPVLIDLYVIYVRFILRPCQHDDGYIDGRSHIKVHTDERIQVRMQRTVFPDGHPSQY